MIRHLFSLFLTLGACAALAQSSTTGSIGGFVKDSKGSPMPDVAVEATHVQSGTRYITTTRENGQYVLANMRVDGSYTVKFSMVGFQTIERFVNQIFLNQRTVLNVVMAESSTMLDDVTIVADLNDPMRSDRTGQETSVTNQQIQALPSIRRSQDDFLRLNPAAAAGGSFAGRNDQFNNYSIDGAIFNNPFGLDASTPGGQAEAQPISLDAIEQINVALAPYDVTKAGFTGAAVNVVTKSGTNEIHGTVFGYFRNKNMYGDKVAGTEVFRGDLRQHQAGFSLGGPIVRDRLFFFVNYEQSRARDLGSYFVANRGQQGSNVSRVLASDLEFVSALLKQKFGYDTGPYENFRFNTNSDKALAKLDFNINEMHKLSVTGTFLTAFKEKPAHPSAIGRRGPDFQTLQFRNAGYRINNNLYGGIAELRSTISRNWVNKAQVGYTAFRDSRDPFSDPFPVLNISKNGVRYIVAGHEPFSIHNRLHQNVYQFTDNLTYYAGEHAVTGGISFERFDFDNSFNLTGYGTRVISSDVDIANVDSLINSPEFAQEVATARAAAKDNEKGPHKFGNWALAETNLGQLATYIQDEWQINEDLNFIYGLRMDMPLYFDTKTKMQENIDRNCCYDPTIQYYDANGAPVKLNSLEFPKQRPLISPRLGFNYDMSHGKRSAVLRGGSGMFTGRFPFVWIGNQVANPNFFYYCVTDPDFRFPQVWRTNLGYDQRFGQWVASLDLIYTKDINAMMVRNYGLKKPTGVLQGPGARPIYTSQDKGSNTAYVFTNTNLGYSFNGSFQLERRFGSGLYIKGAYNYMDVRDAASIDAEISLDAFDRNPANVLDVNTAELAPSLYGNRHRLLGVVSKKWTYGNWGTLVSFFGEAVEGNRYSYTYAGDINNDGSSLNDLLYVPTVEQLNQMTFSGDAAAQAAQRAAFNSYIEQDKYLSRHRGQFTRKYDALSPWYTNVDVRLIQEYNLPNKNSIQFNIDVLNIGNMLNSKWGVRRFATYTGLAQPLAVSVDSDGQPVYTFDTNLKSTFFNDFSLLSRWQMQMGLRYIF